MSVSLGLRVPLQNKEYIKGSDFWLARRAYQSQWRVRAGFAPASSSVLQASIGKRLRNCQCLILGSLDDEDNMALPRGHRSNA
jgi:hypothetical protein